MLRHFFDRADDCAFSLCFGVEEFELLQGESGEIGRRPSPKVLRRDLLAADFAQVIVDVSRIDRMTGPLLVQVLKQFIAGQVAAVLDDARQPAVIDVRFVPDAVFAAEVQMDAAAVDLDMPIAQSSQTVALVSLDVFGVANAKQGCLHQAHDRGEHPLSRQTAPPEIGFDALPDGRQNPAKRQHLAVFRLVANLAPTRVIAVLLAAALVPSGRLDMAVWIGTDPYRSPGGRNRQRTNALQG